MYDNHWQLYYLLLLHKNNQNILYTQTIPIEIGSSVIFCKSAIMIYIERIVKTYQYDLGKSCIILKKTLFLQIIVNHHEIMGVLLGKWLCNERVILVAIVLNTIVMFIGGFWPSCRLFEISDALFTLLFLIEAISKISKYGWKKYWNNGWNRFDLFVLLIALPSLASLFVGTSMATSTILALRSMRLFKSFRMFRFIPNIYKLLNGIKLAFKASLLVFIAFIVLLIIFSIISSTIFGNIAPKEFGDPAISLYNIFRLFTVEGWYELPNNIATEGSAWRAFARIYFSVLVFLGGIIGMSLINSIFVDAMAEDNNDEVMEKLRKLEEKLDKLTKQEHKS